MTFISIAFWFAVGLRGEKVIFRSLIDSQNSSKMFSVFLIKGKLLSVTYQALKLNLIKVRRVFEAWSQNFQTVKSQFRSDNNKKEIDSTLFYHHISKLWLLLSVYFQHETIKLFFFLLVFKAAFILDCQNVLNMQKLTLLFLQLVSR